MTIIRQEFKTPEEARKFTQENQDIRVTGTFVEDRNGTQILVINYFRVI